MKAFSTISWSMGRLCLIGILSLMLNIFATNRVDAQVVIMIEEINGKTFIESDPLEELGVTLYPNPATTQVNLRPDDGLQITKVEIFNAQGVKVFESTLPLGQATADISQGTYTFKIFTDSTSPLTKSVVILP